jgi:Flp pilus assembly pilin Flp
MNLFMFRSWLSASLSRDERGANLVEYILLVSLIALAVIAAVVFMRGELSGSFDNAGSRLSNAPNP